jgi:hypothetical protein
VSAATIYDFETIIPDAVKSVLQDAGLNAFSLSDEKDFQTTRPRVEVHYRQIGETNPKRLATLPDGSQRTSCFRGELKLFAITDVDPAGKQLHSNYRAQVRAVIGGLQNALNGTALTNHRINFTVSGNEETGVRSADGYQQTTFPFVVDISIQQDAWSQL